MSSYYFYGQTAAISGSTGTFTGSVTSGGQFLGANGTAAAPGFAFTSAAGTGLYRPSANALGLSTNGTLALTLSAAQAATFASTVGATGYSASAAAALTLSNAAPAINSTAATTYLQTIQNNGSTVLQLDKGGYFIRPTIDPSTYYRDYDWDDNANTGSFIQAGTVNSSAINSITAGLVSASNMGVALAETTSTTAGGYISAVAAYPIIASASINYQWRILFYHPVASTSSNRYVSSVGAMTFTGAATHAGAAGQSGPYISYSDNLNSGNWQMNSAVAGTVTSGNSSTSATPALGAWNTLTITLANGTYTFVVNGVTIGTLADANIAATPTNGLCAGLGGIAILPDGSNFTTARVMLIDRCDFYVTGLTR